MLMIAVGGRSSVHICARRPADWHVPLQVQVDETDPHVQRPQAPALLPLQHCESPTIDLTHQWVSCHRPDPPACVWVSVLFTRRIVDMCIRIVRAAWRNYRVAPKKTSRWTLLVRMLPDVLQCSVVTCLRCVVIFTSTDLLLSYVMKECCKLISVWQRYGQQYSCRFLICSG